MDPLTTTNAAGPPSVPGDLCLCLAGSGYRAALFQAGALCRMNELGLLARANAIHGVAGGSLVLGVLARHWPDLETDAHDRIIELEHYVIDPIRRFVRKRWSLQPGVSTRLRPRNWSRLWNGQFTETDRLVEHLDRRLFNQTKLVDLAEHGVSFRWQATNLRTGGKWEFTPGWVGEQALGFRWPEEISLAETVAASMIEPADMPPLLLRSKPEDFDGGAIDDRSRRLRARTLLVDGAIHDPLAIEAAIGRYQTIIVCDGGSVVSADLDYKDWVGSRILRTLAIQQFRNVDFRRRGFVEAIRHGRVQGTYVALAGHHADYGLPDSRGYSLPVAEQIWEMTGGMTPPSRDESEVLINHGYTIADAAIRRLLPHRVSVQAPLRLPHPDATGDKLIRTSQRKAA